MTLKSLVIGGILAASLAGSAGSQGNQPNYSQQPESGTTNPQGQPNHQGATVNHETGNTATAPTPVGTDPTFSPANRNPYNDRNYRPGTPGTSTQGGSANTSDPRISNGNPNTLGTSAPSENPRNNGQVTPGLGASTGRSGSPGVTGTPSGNPGPEGPPVVGNTAPTGGAVGTNGSGASGIPGSITNSGTHGTEGSGH